MNLRPYQLQAIGAMRNAMRQGRRRILLQIPTGGGKTLTAASMLAGTLAKGRRSMFVAHRMELIDQTVATFARLGITSLGVIRAQDRRAAPEQPIQVASIQTLARRSKPEASIVFIDEAHRAAAKSYTDMLAHYPQAFVVGLSATPIRQDGRPLGGELFEHLIHGARYSELIAQGYLVAPDVFSTPVLPDLSAVRTSHGDYNAEDLEAAVNRRALIGNILSEWQKRAGGRRTVIFAVSIPHSRAIVEEFTQAGVSAEHLDGTTPEDLRRAMLRRLEQGTTQVVCNVGVLCEGWDMPSCKCLVLARPTKSLGLYMQMSGRILRPWEGVTPVILDHGGNVDRHGMPHEDRDWSLSDKPKKIGASRVKACPGCFAMIPGSSSQCPHCGHEFTHDECEPVEQPEPLTGVALALRSLEGEDAQLSFFRAQCKLASERRYKPGYVLHRYKERWGELPPRKWWNALKRACSADAEWASTLATQTELPS